MFRRQSTLKVIEIFPSIQGESTFQGLPSVFVRLSGCNLRCRYCDTTYAYSGGTERSIPEITGEAQGYGIARVCVTGGEPLLQPETPELVREFLGRGFAVSVETNGSIDASPLPEASVRVIDVKCPSSGEAGTIHPRNIEAVRSSDEFKFVLGDRGDFEFARAFARDNRLPERACVLFSQVRNALDPRVLADWIVREMPEARLSLQLHTFIWPDEPRGR